MVQERVDSLWKRVFYKMELGELWNYLLGIEL